MPPTRKKPSDRTRLINARRVISEAIATAARVKTDPSASRSTATRNSYKIKAEALDRVARVLAGKE